MPQAKSKKLLLTGKLHGNRFYYYPAAPHRATKLLMPTSQGRRPLPYLTRTGGPWMHSYCICLRDIQLASQKASYAESD
jgi:hypothetical protein